WSPAPHVRREDGSDAAHAPASRPCGANQRRRDRRDEAGLGRAFRIGGLIRCPPTSKGPTTDIPEPALGVIRDRDHQDNSSTTCRKRPRPGRSPSKNRKRPPLCSWTAIHWVPLAFNYLHMTGQWIVPSSVRPSAGA